MPSHKADCRCASFALVNCKSSGEQPQVKGLSLTALTVGLMESQTLYGDPVQRRQWQMPSTNIALSRYPRLQQWADWSLESLTLILVPKAAGFDV